MGKDFTLAMKAMQEAYAYLQEIEDPAFVIAFFELVLDQYCADHMVSEESKRILLFVLVGASEYVNSVMEPLEPTIMGVM